MRKLAKISRTQATAAAEAQQNVAQIFGCEDTMTARPYPGPRYKDKRGVAIALCPPQHVKRVLVISAV